ENRPQNNPRDRMTFSLRIRVPIRQPQSQDPQHYRHRPENRPDTRDDGENARVISPQRPSIAKRNDLRDRIIRARAGPGILWTTSIRRNLRHAAPPKVTSAFPTNLHRLSNAAPPPSATSAR